MGHKIKSCSYKNTAARNARALQKSQEGPIFLRIILIFMLAPALCFAYLCKFTQILQLPQNTKGGIARC